MTKLSCDICNGALVMQEGGTQLICEVCGVKYTAERIREKAASLQKKADKQPAANANDQKYTLVSKYYDSGDFSSAERVVKKMLEATPDDPEANRLYDELQVLKHMKIVDGVLVKYSGQAEKLTLPNCVKEIGEKAFSQTYNLKHITFNNDLKKIGAWAFSSSSIEEVILPNSLTFVGTRAFWNCSQLKKLVVPSSATRIMSEAFGNCSSLIDVSMPDHLATDDVFDPSWGEFETLTSPWFRNHPNGIASFNEYAKEEAKRQEELRQDSLMREEWRAQGRCNWCGGRFSLPEWFTGHPRYCTKCGEPKNY